LKPKAYHKDKVNSSLLSSSELSDQFSMQGVDSLAPMRNMPLFQHCLIKTLDDQFKSVRMYEGMKSCPNPIYV